MKCLLVYMLIVDEVFAGVHANCNEVFAGVHANCTQ